MRSVWGLEAAGPPTTAGLVRVLLPLKDELFTLLFLLSDIHTHASAPASAPDETPGAS